MGKINYSLVLRPNPMDEEADKKWYAAAQVKEVVGINEFAKHIASHGCVYSRADIQAVLTLAVDCIKELVLDGKKVQLGELGAFTASITSKGKLNAAEFLPEDHIKTVKGRFVAGALLKNLKPEADFNQVPTRAVQAATLKALNGDKPTGSGGRKQTTATVAINTTTASGSTGSYTNKK